MCIAIINRDLHEDIKLEQFTINDVQEEIDRLAERINHLVDYKKERVKRINSLLKQCVAKDYPDLTILNKDYDEDVISGVSLTPSFGKEVVVFIGIDHRRLYCQAEFNHKTVDEIEWLVNGTPLMALGDLLPDNKVVSLRKSFNKYLFVEVYDLFQQVVARCRKLKEGSRRRTRK